MKFIENHADDLVKGLIALVATTFAALTGAQEQVEFGLRCFMYGSAGCVSLLTGWSIWRKNRRR